MLEGWLDIAKRKAEQHGFDNLDFKVMNIERLEFPDNTFNHVISNFVLCCCFLYDNVVKEAYRVLKPAGRFTYNHDGPHASVQPTLFDKISSKYKLEQPSESLRKLREANQLQENLFARYKDPFAAMGSMRGAGFENVEAKIVYHTHTFSSMDSYMDEWFYLGPDNLELLEMGPQKRLEMRKELSSALQPFISEEGFRDEVETVYVTGIK